MSEVWSESSSEPPLLLSELSQGKFAVLSKQITFYDNTNSKMTEEVPKPKMTEGMIENRRLELHEKGKSEMDEAAQT